ncbi:MAG: DUF5343 domain-containing protein [Acidimicrobiales bacterium]|jgi:hypothetical protein
MTSLTPGGPAPYTTAQSLITVLDAYRDKGLGSPVTPDVLTRAGVAESIAARTLNSAKMLGLIGDDGIPSPQFEDLRKIRDDEEYRKRIEEWLRGVYADVLQYTDPSADSVGKVAGAFRTYEPAGRRPQMAALLIGLWRYAGLPVVENAPPTKPRRQSPRPAKATTKQGTSDGKGRGRLREEDGGIGAPTPGLPPALLGLIQQIPTGGESWTEGRRKAFLDAFVAVLDYTVPVGAPPSDRDEEEVGSS